jgi:tetratricopeptide (TPR) repeat protein
MAKNGDREAKQEAKARFVSGQRHYNLNELGEALGDFKEAYRLLPDPVFLYNLGQCERQLGHLEEAIRFYRSFLREQPKAANRQEVARKIDEMEATLRSKPAEADKSVSDTLASAAEASPKATPGPAPTDRTGTPTAMSEPALPQSAAIPDQAKSIPSSATVHHPAVIPLAAPPSSADLAKDGLARMELTAAPSAPAATASPAFYSHWWFWPAAGVLAVGAGLGFYAAIASRSPAAPSSALGSKKVF